MSTSTSNIQEPLWLQIARAEVGVREIPGSAANKRIAEYHSVTSLKATSDEVPWCASFVGWCLLRAGVVGTGSAAAKSYLTWGVSCGPALGAIVVIKHRTPGGVDGATGSSSGYHVGFLVSKTDSHVNILGGNQADSVKVSEFPLSKYQVIDYRMPRPLPPAA